MGKFCFCNDSYGGIFPIFFKSYWASDLSDAESTFVIGSANSLVGLVIAVSAPILGAIADASIQKKDYLIFATIGIISTGYLFLFQSSWKFAITFYAVGVIGFSGGNIFYDFTSLNIKSRSKESVSLGFSWVILEVVCSFIKCIDVFLSKFFWA